MNENGNGRRLLTPSEVAEILRIGTSTVYRLAERKVLPSVGIPGTHVLRIPSDGLDVLLRRWSSEGFTPRRHKYPETRRKTQREQAVPGTTPEPRQ